MASCVLGFYFLDGIGMYKHWNVLTSYKYTVWWIFIKRTLRRINLLPFFQIPLLDSKTSSTTACLAAIRLSVLPAFEHHAYGNMKSALLTSCFFHSTLCMWDPLGSVYKWQADVYIIYNHSITRMYYLVCVHSLTCWWTKSRLLSMQGHYE